jgi:hypothetical protein
VDVHVSEDVQNAIVFNPVALSIPEWRVLELLRWMQNMRQSTWDHDILYADRSSKRGKSLI